MTSKRPKPVVLVILDGWGHREELAHNAIAQAKTPYWDSLEKDYPHGLINASELHVGLPEGQMGNSEVGHMNIGSGRVLMQELPKIDASIKDGTLAKNPALVEFITKLKKSGGACHLMGLLSPGGVHSHQSHMAATAKIVAAAGVPVFVHMFLDGRDTPPQSALEYIAQFEKEAPGIAVGTVSGRYYAMDRDKRWDRVQKAYDVLTAASSEGDSSSVTHVINFNYLKDVTDEFIPPESIAGYPGMKDGDGVLMANFRADRAREILEALLNPEFKDFPRKAIKFAAALGFVEYSTAHAKWMTAMVPPEKLTKILGEVVSDAGLKQLRCAETEKYAHVTFFFNGGREKEFPGEERILIPSPKVATYDLKPEMSAYEVTEALEKAIAAETFDLIVVNYANTDMVGHSGDLKAAAKAVEAVDHCLKRLCGATLAKGGALLITADHGNAETMYDEETHQPHTAHTLNLVPVIIAGQQFKGKHFAIPEGKLGDVAPTILQLLGLPQPAEMTGRSLLANAQ